MIFLALDSNAELLSEGRQTPKHCLRGIGNQRSLGIEWRRQAGLITLKELFFFGSIELCAAMQFANSCELLFGRTAKRRRSRPARVQATLCWPQAIKGMTPFSFSCTKSITNSLQLFQLRNLIRIHLASNLQKHLRGCLLQRSASLAYRIDGGKKTRLIHVRILVECIQFRLFAQKGFVTRKNGRLVRIEDGIHLLLLLLVEADRPYNRLVIPPATDRSQLQTRVRGASGPP